MQTIGICCFYLTRKNERKVEEEMPYERGKECNPLIASSSGNNFVNTDYVR
jgi:hypothetical protein